jgi:hypothetical protein
VKVAWFFTPGFRDGDPASMVIETENNKEAIALRKLLESFGVSIPKECLPSEEKEWWKE